MLKAQLNSVPFTPLQERLIVHSKQTGIVQPLLPNKTFAVMKIGCRQYKVTMDDTVVLDKLDYQVGNKVVFDKILLVGTPEYTAIGRPYLEAKVEGFVEEQTKSEKIIIYKKERREHFKRNHGDRQLYTIVRISNIIHSIPDGPLLNAGFLQE